MTNTVLSTALSGLNRATQRVDAAASSLSGAHDSQSSGGEGRSMPQDIIDIKLGEVAYKANVALIETAEEMHDTLLKSLDEHA